MDPTANLAEQRAIIKWLNECDLDSTDESEVFSYHSRLAELTEDLDSWITRGGHLPQQWTKARGK